MVLCVIPEIDPSAVTKGTAPHPEMPVCVTIISTTGLQSSAPPGTTAGSCLLGSIALPTMLTTIVAGWEFVVQTVLSACALILSTESVATAA